MVRKDWSKMAPPSPAAKDLKVAFWGKNNTTGSDVKSGIEAIKRKKEGGHTNKSTQDLIDKLKKSGEW